MVCGNFDSIQSELCQVVKLAQAYPVKVNPRSWVTTSEVNYKMSGMRYKPQKVTRLLHEICLLWCVVGLVTQIDLRIGCLGLKACETLEY